MLWRTGLPSHYAIAPVGKQRPTSGSWPRYSSKQLRPKKWMGRSIYDAACKLREIWKNQWEQLLDGIQKAKGNPWLNTAVFSDACGYPRYITNHCYLWTTLLLRSISITAHTSPPAFHFNCPHILPANKVTGWPTKKSVQVCAPTQLSCPA